MKSIEQISGKYHEYQESIRNIQGMYHEIIHKVQGSLCWNESVQKYNNKNAQQTKYSQKSKFRNGITKYVLKKICFPHI